MSRSRLAIVENSTNRAGGAGGAPVKFAHGPQIRPRRPRIVRGTPLPAFFFWTPSAVWAAASSATGVDLDVHKMTVTDKILTVLVVTATSLINGALIGGVFGMVSGAWTQRSWSAAWTNAKSNGLSWGGLSAAYSGLQTVAKVVRKREDKFNNVIGACGSGALFSASGGPQAAARGCASFALFSYVIESFLVQPDNRSEEEKFLSGK